MAVERDAADMFPDVLLWHLNCNPFKFIAEQLGQRCWVAFEIGLTHSPVYRHLKVSPHKRSYSDTSGQHSIEFKKMYVLWVGPAEGARKPEDDLISNFKHCDGIENRKGGGEGAVDGTTTFVYAVANSLNEHMELRNALRKKWVARNQWFVALAKQRRHRAIQRARAQISPMFRGVNFWTVQRRCSN